MSGKQLVLGLLGAFALLMSTWAGVSYFEDSYKTEHLSYQVIEKIEDGQRNLESQVAHSAEIRSYPSYIMAQVVLNNVSMDKAMNEAFHILAGYIFGDNEAVDGSGSTKIPMTAPVITEEISQNTYKISFVMPSHYTLETLPKPNNSDIKIVVAAPTEMAAISWKGNVPSSKEILKEESELMNIIDENSYEHEVNMYLFEYDPPFTPSWMRNNEILVKVHKKE